MFYVSGTKIYLATYDEDLKAYPECKLMLNKDGTMYIKKTGGGVAKKPPRRRLCTLAEIVAQLGSTAIKPVAAAPKE